MASNSSLVGAAAISTAGSILSPTNTGSDEKPEENEVQETHPFAEPWKDSDLVLVVEDEKFHVHRQMLSIHSPVFQAMLSFQFKEATAKEIPLPGKKAHEVLDFLKQMYLKESDGVTLMNMEHLLKLADEYQTKSVFDLCVNYLRLLPRSKENAVRILFLANITVMVREDKRLDSVRSECCNLIKNMALQEILKKEDFKNLDRDSLENVLEKRVERLEHIVKEVYPQFIGLVEFCLMLCLESSYYRNSKIISCPEHFPSDNKANWDLFTRISTCAVCRKMISQLVSISKLSKLSAVQGGLFGQTETEERRYGGTYHFDRKLTSIIKDFHGTYCGIDLIA